jgi:hypothetical protein
MKKYGYYVRLGGDAEVSATLARGDVATLLPAPMDRNEACRRVAMWQHTPQEWREMTLDARRRYRRWKRQWQRNNTVGTALPIGYAMLCYGVQVAFDWLWEAIERRR